MGNACNVKLNTISQPYHDIDNNVVYKYNSDGQIRVYTKNKSRRNSTIGSNSNQLEPNKTPKIRRITM